MEHALYKSERDICSLIHVIAASIKISQRPTVIFFPIYSIQVLRMPLYLTGSSRSILRIVNIFMMI